MRHDVKESPSLSFFAVEIDQTSLCNRVIKLSQALRQDWQSADLKAHLRCQAFAFAGGTRQLDHLFRKIDTDTCAVLFTRKSHQRLAVTAPYIEHRGSGRHFREHHVQFESLKREIICAGNFF